MIKINNHYINRSLRLGLRNPNPQPGRFYTLPKIHKNLTPPPGRPIVSCNNTVTEQISSYIDHFLQQFVPTLPSYIQDTTDFLRKLQNLIQLGPLPEGATLVVLDVNSLYTNIPQAEGKEACKTYLNQRPKNIPSTDWLLKLIDLILTGNNFTFNNKNYLQKQGTAMGTKMAPAYANLFMGILENKLLQNAGLQPMLWWRYIDDIFLIWTHGNDEWDTFFNYLNSAHPSIKFTATTSQHNLSFLDVNVIIDNNRIHTDLYSKPTDSHNYLSWTSCHPYHCKKGIAYSLALRLKRICSKPIDLRKRLQELYSYLRNCNFPHNIILKGFNQANIIRRSDALKYKNRKEGIRVPFVISYHPDIKNLPYLIRNKHEDILLRSKRCREIFQNPPVVSYRRPLNLKNYLVKATLGSTTRSQNRNMTPGFTKCNNAGTCKIHDSSTASNTFASSVTGKTFNMDQSITCDTKNVIYLITCRKENCMQQYVGQTGRAFNVRAGEHITNTIAKIIHPVQKHFNSKQHNVDHLNILPIEIVSKFQNTYRLERENFWIDLIKPRINVMKQ